MVQSSLCLAVYCEGSQLARDQTDEGSDKLCCDGLRPDWWWQWSHDCRDQKIECERNSLLVEWWIQITSHRQTVLRQWNSSKMETNSWSSSCSWFSILSLFKPASLPSASKFLEISPFYLAIPLAFHSLPFPSFSNSDDCGGRGSFYRGASNNAGNNGGGMLVALLPVMLLMGRSLMCREHNRDSSVAVRGRRLLIWRPKLLGLGSRLLCPSPNVQKCVSHKSCAQTTKCCVGVWRWT